MPPSRALLPLTRRDRVRVLAGTAIDGFAIGTIAANLVNLATGTSPDVGTAVKALGALGMLVGAVLARIRLPAMGAILDGDGVELHGLLRTRRLTWGQVRAVGWARPGRRFAVTTTGGRVRRGPGRLPRRVPAELAAVAAAHGVAVGPPGTLKSGPAPTIGGVSPGR